jgi:spore germination cell wall hydrolase CwlJ-like protein
LRLLIFENGGELIKIILALFLFFTYSPLVDGPVPEYRPKNVHKYRTSDFHCLANALHFEARGEPPEGRRAVLESIQHRMKASGKSACHVISRPRQYSWYDGSFKPLTISMKKMLTEAQEHDTVLPEGSYQWFFSTKVLKNPPYWAKKMDCVQVGNHRFCKLKEKMDDFNRKEARDF